jgi:hypothetical protein
MLWKEFRLLRKKRKVGEKVFSPSPSSIFVGWHPPRGEAKPTKIAGRGSGREYFPSLTLPAVFPDKL